MNALVEKGWDKWRVARWTAAAALLLTPLVAMQFTREVAWGVGDFVFAAFMIVGTGLLYEFAGSRSGLFAYRAAAAIGLGTGFLIVWSNLAVGIVGDEDNPTNIIFFALVAMVAVAAYAGEFRARAMARATLCVAAVQALVGVMVATAPINAGEPTGPVGLLGINLFFALLWLLSSGLFRKAARDEARNSA